MSYIEKFLEGLVDLVPAVAALIGLVVVIVFVRFLLERRFSRSADHKFRTQLILLVLSFIGLLVVILALPISEATTGQLLSLIGILLSAAIALSATTFVGNIMAGMMQRMVKNFRPGDFIRVGEHFGRVSDRGLFHVEIQTEDRDLTTMPNLYLATNPVKVIRSDGTLITAEVSLGYDVPRGRVETALVAAAHDAELEEPFVHITNLGDFSVTYRAAGLLTDVKSLLSTRSRLRAAMLDRLHEAGIEIVSPTFMNQRPLDPSRKFMPPPAVREAPTEHPARPEDIVFDKAEEAASVEKLVERREALKKQIDEMKDRMNEAADEAVKAELEIDIESARARLERLDAYIAARREKGE
jgi:small-conductance mechanosensitive channel